MKKLSIIILVLAGVIMSGCNISENDVAGRDTDKTNDLIEEKTVKFAEVQIGEQHLHVEVVDQPASIQLGLGNRDQIGSDGMLFVLPQRQVARFWMYQMRFPIDMVWIDQDEVIGAAINALPETSQDLSEYQTYVSPGHVTHVLELPAGSYKQMDLQVGDKFLIISPI